MLSIADLNKPIGFFAGVEKITITLQKQESHRHVGVFTKKSLSLDEGPSASLILLSGRGPSFSPGGASKKEARWSTSTCTQQGAAARSVHPLV